MKSLKNEKAKKTNFDHATEILEKHLLKIKERREIDQNDIKLLQLALNSNNPKDEGYKVVIIDNALKSKYFKDILDESTSKSKSKKDTKRNVKDYPKEKGDNKS